MKETPNISESENSQRSEAVNKSKRQVSVRQAEEIATRTVDAYSFDRYGWAAWKATAQMLARRGYNVAQIESILRSKWMRWAGDMADTSSPTSQDVARYLDKYAETECSLENVNRLVAGTL